MGLAPHEVCSALPYHSEVIFMTLPTPPRPRFCPRFLPPSRTLRRGLGPLALLAVTGLAACSPADAAPDRASWLDGPRVQVTPERLLSIDEPVQSVEDVTPDGRAIIISGGRMGRLGRIDITSEDTTWLTSAEAPYEPTWVLEAVAHPDGERVAYHELTNATNDWRPLVWRPDGDPLVLPDVEDYWNVPEAWSPDGRRLLTNAGSSAEARLYAYDLASGRPPVPLITGPDLSAVVYHPGGEWIAYSRRVTPGAEQRGVFLLRADGSREVRFDGIPDDAELVGWSADGESVLYERPDAESPTLWRQAVDGTRVVGAPVLIQWDRWGMESIGLDRNGHFFYAIDTSRRDLFTVALDADGLPTGEPIRRPAGAGAIRLDYSPDGGSLVFLRSGDRGAAGRQIVIESRETGVERVVDLGVPIRYVSWPKWTVEGDALIVKVIDDRDRYAFYRYDLATAAVDTLRVWNGPGIVGLHEPTPDGGGVVFSFREAGGEDAGPWRLEYLDLETREERVLAEVFYPEEEGRPGWMEVSPDGSRLAFATSRGIRILDLATGEGALAVDAPEPVSWRTRPSWHPDGRYIYFGTQDFDDVTGAPVPGTLRRADLETGEVVDLGISAESFDVVDVHPGGMELSFGTLTWGPTEIWRIPDVFEAPVASAAGAGDRRDIP